MLTYRLTTPTGAVYAAQSWPDIQLLWIKFKGTIQNVEPTPQQRADYERQP
jgi:hypothetical protein